MTSLLAVLPSSLPFPPLFLSPPSSPLDTTLHSLNMYSTYRCLLLPFCKVKSPPALAACSFIRPHLFHWCRRVVLQASSSHFNLEKLFIFLDLALVFNLLASFSSLIQYGRFSICIFFDVPYIFSCRTLSKMLEQTEPRETSLWFWNIIWVVIAHQLGSYEHNSWDVCSSSLSLSTYWPPTYCIFPPHK